MRESRLDSRRGAERPLDGKQERPSKSPLVIIVVSVGDLRSR